MDIFDRYAPFVQDYIYRSGWESLRAIQVAAANAIFRTDGNLLLTASTASGKTEAAFFPIITLFSEDPPSSVGCIYIGPLKALINDQFARLNDLCEEADIPVWHWHGDVAQSHKARLMKRPSGILQITPESLEAMLLHKHGAIASLFGDLRFVVIDEVHSLLRGDRGGQTLCLIERLSRLAGVNPRRIGLSATMGDPERTGEFLSLGTGRKTVIPKIEAKGSKWRLSMEHFYVKDVQAAEDRTDIPWKLLQGIALVQLYLEERWVEPPRLDRLPFSLLYHQTMSTLASCGELSPRALADRVLRLHYFHRISQEDYRVLLRHLVETDHIQRTEHGGLIVGLAGERVVNSFKFYGVFEENEEYTVRSEAQELGTVVLPPPVGEKLAIAGHVWVVLDIDRKRHLVYCEQVKGSIPAYFGLCPGDLHTKILQRMRQVLREDRSYPYLMKNAVARLEQARFTADRSGTGERPLIHLGGNMWCLLPWVGTYTFLTLERFLKVKCAERLGLRNLDPARPYYIQFTMKADEETFFRVAAEEVRKPIDPMELVYPKELPLFNKYDEYLPDELVKKGFALGVLDLDGLRETVLGWRGEDALDR